MDNRQSNYGLVPWLLVPMGWDMIDSHFQVVIFIWEKKVGKFIANKNVDIKE